MSLTNTKPSPFLPPRVLAIAGYDPSGCAGIQADIESIVSSKCLASTLITLNTVQNSHRCIASYPQSIAPFKAQCDFLFSSMDINAIKVGVLGSDAIVNILCQQLKLYLDKQKIPIIFDPVLNTTSGYVLSTHFLADKFIKGMAGGITLITPNRFELTALTGISSIELACKALLRMGIGAVLVTGLDMVPSKKKQDLLFTKEGQYFFEHQILPGTYRGSGCTLSSTIAAQLAKGTEFLDAINIAIDVTFLSLKQAHPLAKDVYLPKRS